MNLGLLILRLAVGLLFAGHGAQKLFGWFGGHGVEGTGGFFESLGIRPGKLNAIAAGVAELAGGLLLALGLVTPFAAAAIVAVMTVAIITVHAAKGPWSTDGGYEYSAVLIAVAVALAGVGSGKWSLDHALGLHLSGTEWAIGAIVVGVIGGIGAVGAGRAGHREPRPETHPTAA